MTLLDEIPEISDVEQSYYEKLDELQVGLIEKEEDERSINMDTRVIDLYDAEAVDAVKKYLLIFHPQADVDRHLEKAIIQAMETESRLIMISTVRSNSIEFTNDLNIYVQNGERFVTNIITPVLIDKGEQKSKQKMTPLVPQVLIGIGLVYKDRRINTTKASHMEKMKIVRSMIGDILNRSVSDIMAMISRLGYEVSEFAATDWFDDATKLQAKILNLGIRTLVHSERAKQSISVNVLNVEDWRTN